MRFALAIIIGALIVAFAQQQDAVNVRLDSESESAIHSFVERVAAIEQKVEAFEQRKPEVQSCPLPTAITDRLEALEQRVAALEGAKPDAKFQEQLAELEKKIADAHKQVTKADPPKPKTRLQLAKEDAAASNQQLLLVFHQAGCAPCAKLESYLRSIQHTISDRYLVVTADVTDEDVQDFRIPSTPTAFIYDPRTRAWGRPLSGADVYALFPLKGKR